MKDINGVSHYSFHTLYKGNLILLVTVMETI